MAESFGTLLSKLVDKQNWYIRELLAYIEEKGLKDDYCEWQAERNKRRPQNE